MYLFGCSSAVIAARLDELGQSVEGTLSVVLNYLDGKEGMVHFLD